jgi:hypothetical protein
MKTESGMPKTCYLCAAVAALAITVACGSGDNNSNPVSPTAGGSVGAPQAGPDGETLKVTAPNPQAPANGGTLDTFTPTLTVSASTFKYQGAGALTHRFQLLNGSTVIREFTTGGTTWKPSNLENKTTYGWRARGEQGGGKYGPWGATWTFTTPDQPEGYIRPGELYDPLFDGKTVGHRNGAITFVPGVGARMEGFTSHIRYELPQTVEQGEFSMLVTGVLDNSEGGKTKMMAMSEGFADIITNDRRFTLERRGDPKGVVAWRMITHRDQIDTGPDQRRYVQFSPNQTYLIKAVWRSQVLTITMQEGGASGRVIYREAEPYRGAYDPSPHFAYAGTPIGRSGTTAGTVPGMTVRQVWLSVNPRPSFANK